MPLYFRLVNMKIALQILLTSLLLSFSNKIIAQAPANDDCANAINIPIPNGNFGLGVFTSASTNLTNATVQTGESFAPAIFVAGLDKKSVWYKFSIPTIRAVRVTLTQPGTTITAGDAGFTVYKSNTCLPGSADISNKLTPIVTFGNTYHPCVPSGDYLIQVSSNYNANGPINIQIEISDQTGAAYDHPNQAYAFDTVRYYSHWIDFNTECQSIEDSTEKCTAFQNPADYNKTAWLTFTTPRYFDYIVVQLSGTGATSYFPSNNNQDIYRSFGYTLYKGNAVNTPIGSLQTIDGCDSLSTDGFYSAYKIYRCNDLQTATTYSIQLFIKKTFGDDVRISIIVGGQIPTNGQEPTIPGIPAPNAIGVLASSPGGTPTYSSDVWGCNSRHSNHACSPAEPAGGILFNGGNYSLSSFFTFTLNTTCAITFNAYATLCGPNPLVRVFKQAVTNNCTDLDTSNIIGSFVQYNTLDCLPPGDYTVQVTGQEYIEPYNYFNIYAATAGGENCLCGNLAGSFRLDMTAYTRKPSNKYRLNVPGAFDSVNRVGAVIQPLPLNIAVTAASDTMGCLPTLRPIDTTCSPVNNKVIYREFIVADSGVVDFNNLTYTNYSPWRYRLFKGDANALSISQNVSAFPDKVSGMVPITDCMDWNTGCANKRACVTAGTYTFTTMASDADVGRVDQPVFTFIHRPTIHNSPLTAQDMGSIMDTLGPGGGTLKTDVDNWSCLDNAVPINGYGPCVVDGLPATKAIYRQFYLKEPALIRIQDTYYYYCMDMAYGTRTLFYGKATAGMAGLTPVGGQWSCFRYAGTTAGCDLLPAGWYTIVSYNQGPSFDSTMRSINLEGRYNGATSYRDEFLITVTPTCPGPVYDRPYKASIDTSTHQPYLVQWGTRSVSTPVYPRSDTLYTLPTEHFNCTLDTPFSNHHIHSCGSNFNRVAYYVFKTTQLSFLEINAGGFTAALYNKDIRIDSLSFDTLKPVQVCNDRAGYIQFCHFLPGTYTLVIFAGDANICQTVTPTIYIDQIEYSRFDYAKNAYDFGIVPPDSVYHFGKVGDINPLNASRPPSSDFFCCTTGASVSDPTEPVCYTVVNPNVYNSGPNKPLYDSSFLNYSPTRRNLWYTFVIDQPGYVTVRVNSKTPGREYQQKFSVYQSDVDGTLPFSTVKSTGQQDSTIAQGLTYIGSNPYTWYNCANLTDSFVFFRDPCNYATNRYYILVENINSEPYEYGGTLPNTQTEVSILVDSVHAILPKHDHYYQAWNFGNVGVGTYQGDIDNYSCATKDATDPFYIYGYSPQCQKTLWYKFSTGITGNVRYRMRINGNYYYDYYQIQLFRQIIPGDSTTNGLQIQGYSGVYDSISTPWAQTCVSPGTYYIMLTGCGQLNEYEYPEIQLIEAVGDFCSRAVPAAINGPGNVTASVLVNCHTIGTDYGEFGPQLTCPPGANTADYKSSWFRMDIGGVDTLDVTAYLIENTNAASSDIKYRLMTGNCGAMQEQSCVLDALTQNTYQCLVPGQSYYVQVFTPVTKYGQQVTGTIDLKLFAVAHADTCAPLVNCLASANFTTSYDCNTDDSVKFVNFSTYGSSISYHWDFGYNGQTSTAVSPSFFYPVLATAQTYQIKLVVSNTSCGKKDSVIKTITIPGRPYVHFGNDIVHCNSTTPVTLTATSFPGATYTWQDGSSADTFHVTATGNNTYWVHVNYNGCSSKDTIQILLSTLSSKPIQQVILCGPNTNLSAYRGFGETYLWNTGATSNSITVYAPGTYWADIKYYSCIYRDSFIVKDVSSAHPLGNDTTVCLSGPGYTLDATTTGATSYTWQDGTHNSTLVVNQSGQYSVSIQFPNCTIQDTIQLISLPAPHISSIDTAICYGQSFHLPWGPVVQLAGSYNDTLHYSTGCDSIIRQINLTIHPRPFIGNDTTACLVHHVVVLNATTTAATGYTWQDGSHNNTFTANAPGLYWVSVNFGTCSTKDSMVISNVAAPLNTTIQDSICTGSPYTLPWGNIVYAAGTYRDTIPSIAGCDSLIRIVQLHLKNKPSLGNDSLISICNGQLLSLNNIFSTTGLTGIWTVGGNAVLNTSVGVAGIYQLVAINSYGCSDTALLNLQVHPTPMAGNDTIVSVCQGFVTDLTQYLPANGLTSNWYHLNNPVTDPHHIDSGGGYILVANNNFGCADTALLSLTVNTPPHLGRDSSFQNCAVQSLNLNTIYTTTGWGTSWTFNNTPVVNPAAVSAQGIYQLIVTDVNSCKDTALVTLSHFAAPVLGNDTTVQTCSGNAINLSGLYNTTGLISNWTNGVNPVANPAAVLNAGNYQLIAMNNHNCKDTALVTLVVNNNPSLGNDTSISICSNLSFNLSSLYNTNNLTGNWTSQGTAVGDPSNVQVSGLYQLIATNTWGCSDTAIVQLVINPIPHPGNDTTVFICSNNTVNINTGYLLNGLIYQWTLNGNPVLYPSVISSAGIYQLNSVNSFGCKDTAYLNLIVHPAPQLGNDTAISVCAGLPVDLTALYSTSGLSTSWTHNQQVVNNPQAISTGGNYQLIAGTVFGCTDTAYVSIIILNKPDIGPDTAVAFCQYQNINISTLYPTNGLTTNWTLNNSPVATPASIQAPGVYQLIVQNNHLCSDTALVTIAEHPKPLLGNDTLVQTCLGNYYNLTTIYSTGVWTNHWTYNQLPIAQPNAVNNAGVYQLIVQDHFSCTDTADVTLVINNKPLLGNDSSLFVCEGTPKDITTVYPTMGLTSSWSFNNTILIAPTAVIANGIYQLIATNANGCSDTANLTLNSIAAPHLGNDTAINICNGLSINLNQYFVTGNNNNQWTDSGIPVIDPANIQTSGIYQLISTNQAGCKDTANINLSVFPLPMLITNDPTPVCSPQTVDITAASITSGSTSGISLSYWINPDLTQAFDHPATAPEGTYYIKAIDANGCSISSPINIRYYPKPLLYVSNDVTICDNDSVRLTASVGGNPTSIQYQWEPVNGSNISSPTMPVTFVKPSVSQQFTITVTDTAYGCNYITKDSVLVTVQPPVIAFAGNDTNAVKGLPLQLQASGGVNYSWTPATGLSNPFIDHPLATLYADSMQYIVTVKDIIGCTAYDTIFIRVYDEITYYVPNAFTPNGDSKNDVFKPIAVGIIQTELFMVFNRYGEIMYQTNDWNKGWDGNFKGIPQPPGNYVWIIKGKALNGKAIEMKGNVVLIR